MRDGGGDERPRAGGEPAAAVEIILCRGQGEQVVNVEYKPEKRARCITPSLLSSSITC